MRAKDLHDAPLEERVDAEARLWDRVRDEAHQDKSLLQLSYPTYESFFTSYPEWRYVYDFFGPSVAGKRILEVGCGAGVLSVALANSGADVTAVDVSASGLRVTRERAEFHGVADRVHTVQTPAERLEFPAGSFDLFFAKSVVHHLIIDDVMPRVYRALVPGGRAAIVEPQSNPVLDFAREHVPYPGKVAEGEHGTDVFFTREIIRQIIGHFDRGEFREFRLFSMFEQFIRGGGSGFDQRRSREARVRRYRQLTDPLDATLFRLLPPLRRLAQYVVILLERRPD